VNVTAHRQCTVTASRIATRIDLEPQKTIDLGLRIDPSAPDGSALPRTPTSNSTRSNDGAEHFAWVSVKSNRVAKAIIASNIRDFSSIPMLEGSQDEWLALQAGLTL
jgi:hypothetical protein